MISEKDNHLSQKELGIIRRALRVWASKVRFKGNTDEYLGVAWEAWTEGVRLGYDGQMLTNRIVWRLIDAQRQQTSPLRLFGASIERLEKIGKGFLGANSAESVYKALQTWAIETYPELTPVWKCEVLLEEVKNLDIAKRRTIWYLSEMGQGVFSGKIRPTTLTGIHVLMGREIVLKSVRRMRYRLRKLGYQNILMGKWGSGSVL